MPFVTIGGITLHHRRVEANSEARPIVFINSLGTDFRIWDDVVSALDGEMPLLVYDKRGHGLSDIGDIRSIDDHVDDLVDAGPLHDEPSFDAEVFPEGVNVEFVVRRGPGHIAMRVHERGAGETRSCGTGACAAALATADGEGPGRWRVDVPGGTLYVARDEAGHIHLTGPAVIVARGETDL